MTDSLSQLNAKLKADRIRVRVVTRGDRLYLRATLPPVPGSQKSEPNQQRIALGLENDRYGIRKAESRARQLDQQLKDGQFCWTDWGKTTGPIAETKTARDWAIAFERDYFSRRSANPKSETTWKHDYQAIFDRLPIKLPLSAEAILQTVLDTAPDSRNRQRTCQALSALARFAGISINLSHYRGQYNHKSVLEIPVPNDDLILEVRDRISKPEWQWAFGILAAYGIRPSELLHCDLADFPRLDVLDGKTGRRTCYPLPKEWAEDWQLGTVQRPKISGRSNTDMGHRVNHAFKRLGVPFPPKVLRHAWAIRAIDFLPVEIAAKQQGHSVEVHVRTYQRWLDDRRFRQFFE